jgi:hypothetical protein
MQPTHFDRDQAEPAANKYRYLVALAKYDKAAGMSEIDFINQFAESSQEAALKAYQEAQ